MNRHHLLRNQRQEKGESEMWQSNKIVKIFAVPCTGWGTTDAQEEPCDDTQGMDTGCRDCNDHVRTSINIFQVL